MLDNLQVFKKYINIIISTKSIYSHSQFWTSEHTLTAESPDTNPVSPLAQTKRSTRPRGPYNANRRSRYVEMVLVVDQKVFHENGDDLKATARRTKEIANIVNAVSPPGWPGLGVRGEPVLIPPGCAVPRGLFWIALNYYLHRVHIPDTCSFTRSGI